jgi:tripartite-type tricarboxylate transporter receptor subunit TctC
LPDVPSFVEAGFSDVTLENWTGLMVPAATPAALIDKISRQVISAVQVPEVAQRLNGLGFEVTGLGPMEFARILQRDTARAREWVSSRNIRPD